METTKARGHEVSASAISFEGVSKLYPGTARPALSDVTITVEPGEFVVLIGPSGCGKTTFLKLVNRLLEPTSGAILIDGTPTDSIPGPQLRRRIGYVTQQIGLFPHMRVEDNVAVVPRLLGWDAARTSHRVDQLLSLVGLSPADFRRRYPSQLSGGQQQRVGLARALAGNPSMLLMDEPFGALDAITRRRLQEELSRIHEQMGQTVLFVTHDLEEAVRLADRMVVMREGRVAQYDEPHRVILHPASDFVAKLVGSGDALRRLSLLPVQLALRPLNGRIQPEGVEVPPEMDLRSALSLLVDSRFPRLVVVARDGSPMGTVDLDSIRAANTFRFEARTGGEN
jgi:osmoprotectant transport system ATP-binding protein